MMHCASGAFLLAIVVAHPAKAVPDPAATVTNVARDLGLQTRLPTDPDDKLKPEDEDRSNFRIHLPNGVANAILGSALALGLAVAFFALRDTIPALGSKRTRLPPDGVRQRPMTPAAVERMEATAAEADDLARRGLIVEAMHALLLRSLIELRRRLNVALPDSLTSREILRHLQLPENGRGALADLIQRVELVYFGGRAAQTSDYQACRASYERLTHAVLVEGR